MKRILLADDEDSLLLAYRKLFHGPGVIIDVIKSVSDAKIMLAKNNYDAVIVDLRLTGTMDLDGLEIISSTKGLYPDSKIIALTGYSDRHIKEKVFKAGASYFFEKPISVPHIKELLRNLGIYSEKNQQPAGN